jgi:flagellar assembly protein FliH
MGLIKRNQLEEKGTVLLEKVPVITHRREEGLGERPLSMAGRGMAEMMGRPREVERARSEAERIREEARAEGRREGMEEAASHIEEALTTLNQAVSERKKIINDAESEVLRLALKVAEQIIRSEVSLHRDVCLNIVSEAIGRVSDREQIIVKVNREDAEYLKRFKDRLAGMLDGVKSFSIIEDSNIEPGGCVIETNLGFIDARIATKLKSIEEAVNRVKSEEIA